MQTAIRCAESAASMKLQYPFMQLPLSFDAAALEAEVARHR